MVATTLSYRDKIDFLRSLLVHQPGNNNPSKGLRSSDSPGKSRFGQRNEEASESGLLFSFEYMSLIKMKFLFRQGVFSDEDYNALDDGPSNPRWQKSSGGG